MQTPIIAGRAQTSLRCENQNMLTAARTKLVDDILATEKHKGDRKEKESEVVIASLYGESVIHR